MGKMVLVTKEQNRQYHRDMLGQFASTSGSGQKKNHKPIEKIPIGKADKWLVDEAKKVGLDIDGYKHEITNEFVNHVMNNHGDEKKESLNGQIAIKPDDFNKIPEIIKKPDYIIVGGKYIKGKSRGKSFISYSRKLDDGTTLYFEEVLDGKRNRSLRGKTMYKHKNEVDEQKFFNIVSNSDDVDVSNAKTISLAATGGYPGLNPTTEESGVVANPTETQGSSSVSSEPLKKSRPRRKTVIKKSVAVEIMRNLGIRDDRHGKAARAGSCQA